MNYATAPDVPERSRLFAAGLGPSPDFLGVETFVGFARFAGGSPSIFSPAVRCSTEH
jgi:hypothetical protein